MPRLMPLALAAFAIVYLWRAFAIPLDPWSASEMVNARTMPVAYGVLLLILAVALAVRPAPPRNLSQHQEPRPPAAGRGGWPTVIAHGVAIICFGVLLPFSGLWIALAALLLMGLVIAGERRPLVLALAPVGTALTAWLLIAVVLDVYIDTGRWFS